jgi:rhodanese-related sulfurtransferase/predicted metal-dependent enzyme (double-stranded beta helix superfamily)
MARRHDAVQSTLDEIRRLRDTLGPSEELIDAVGPVLTGLALQEDLFDAATFAVNEGAVMTIHELSVDPDGRLGLYASAGMPGKVQPPHDHRTWSVIAGVRGAEHNSYFERVDDGREPQRGRLKPRGERTLRRGDANGMMGDAFHAIRVLDEGPALHLHLYGYPLDRLAGRVFFDGLDGGVEHPFMGRPDLYTAKVTAGELAAMGTDGEELAVLDTRDVGDHNRGHVPGSCPVPAAELESRLSGLLPRRTVRVVVVGEDDPAAHRAAHQIRRSGFTNVAVLAGGVEAWADAGFDVHDGIHTMSKAFGEYVAHVRGTPMIAADELKRRRENGEAVALVDCRPEPEFAALHVPGATNAPGTELLARVLGMGLEPGTPIAVSCAGRTRSIIGAQTLIDAGVDAPVLALENGTMGWKLAGEELEKRSDSSAEASPPANAQQDAAERARRLAGEQGVRVIGEADLAGWQADHSRTTYVFDVSSPAGYAAGHRPGFASAPGGQLVQELTARTAVPSARIVVADSDGVQSLLTAYWLRLMGRDAYALPDANRGRWLETGTDAMAEPARPTKPYERSVDALQAMRDYIDWELDLLDRVGADNFDLMSS